MGNITAIFASHVLYLSEKLSLCCIAVLLVCCTMITITFVLAFGVGLGYNYCFIEVKSIYMKSRFRYYGGSGLYGAQAQIAELDRDHEDNLRSPLVIGEFPDDSRKVKNDVGTEHEVDEQTDDKPNKAELINISDNEDQAKVPHKFTTAFTESAITVNVTNSDNTTSATSEDNVTRSTLNDNITRITLKDNENVRKSPKMIIPLTGLDLIGLLTRLRADNKNYTLQIVTD